MTTFEEDAMPDDHAHGSVDYWWFQGQTVLTLRDLLVGAGPDAILKVTPKGRELFLEVIEPTEEADVRRAPLNESHICPPACIV